MKVLLTGGTGFVGSAVLEALLARGHDVTALVRSQSSADTVTGVGATAVMGDITDTAWVRDQLAAVDAAIHTASPGDATSIAFDTSMVNAVVAAFGGTDRPYVHTSGVWVYGNGADITEETPFAAPALTAWRPDVEKIVRSSDVKAAIVAPGIVYGYGKGLINVLASGPREASGALHLIGEGTQHWATVHVDDLADLYVRAAEQSAQGYFNGVSGINPTVRELGETIAGGAGVFPETDAETQLRLGVDFAEALLLDQQATPVRATADLGWQPSRPSLVSELQSAR